MASGGGVHHPGLFRALAGHLLPIPLLRFDALYLRRRRQGGGRLRPPRLPHPARPARQPPRRDRRPRRAGPRLDHPAVIPGRLILPALRWRDDTGFAHEAGTIARHSASAPAASSSSADRPRRCARSRRSCASRAGRPLLIAADLERGAGQQFPGLTEFPPPGGARLPGGSRRHPRRRRYHRARGARPRHQLGAGSGGRPRHRARQPDRADARSSAPTRHWWPMRSPPGSRPARRPAPWPASSISPGMDAPRATRHDDLPTVGADLGTLDRHRPGALPARHPERRRHRHDRAPPGAGPRSLGCAGHLLRRHSRLPPQRDAVQRTDRDRCPDDGRGDGSARARRRCGRWWRGATCSAIRRIRIAAHAEIERGDRGSGR